MNEFGAEGAGGGDDARKGDGGGEREAVERVVPRGEESVVRAAEAQQLAVRLHQGLDEAADFVLGGLEALHVAEDARDAAGADGPAAGELVGEGAVDERPEARLGDLVAPDGGALGAAEGVEADGIVETAAAGFVHVVRIGVCDPDGWRLQAVQDAVEEALVARRPAAAAAEEEGEGGATGAAEHVVRLVHNEQTRVRIDAAVRHAQRGEAERGGTAGAVAAAFAARILGNEIAGPACLGGKGASETGLAGAGGAVEQDVGRSGAGGEHLAEQGAVAGGEAAEERPRKGLILVLAEEAARERPLVDPGEEAGEIRREVEVVVERAGADEGGVGRERRADFGHAAVDVHRQRLHARIAVGTAAPRGGPFEQIAPDEIGDEEEVAVDRAEAHQRAELGQALREGVAALAGLRREGGEERAQTRAHRALAPEAAEHFGEWIGEGDRVPVALGPFETVADGLRKGGPVPTADVGARRERCRCREHVIVADPFVEIRKEVAEETHRLRQAERIAFWLEFRHGFRPYS